MSVSDSSREIVVVGAGLVGSLLSLLLRLRGYEVSLYERRADMRSAEIDAGRSINLVATSRCLRALDLANMRQTVLDCAVPVRGRMMHDESGALSYHAYGRDGTEVNYSVGRAELNCLLLNKAEETGVAIHFEQKLEAIAFDSSQVTFATPWGQHVVRAARVIGTDGANSVVRREMQRAGAVESTYDDLGHGYKELEMPPSAAGTFAIAEHALHIWPRGNCMMMALPNHEGSFTVTLYLPHNGPVSVASLDSEAAVMELFEQAFPDALPLIPDVAGNYLRNPIGKLGTVRCQTWHHRDRALVIGDAAHAIVPFFGQGMNCGFEDARILVELIEQYENDWERIFAECTRLRKPNADAIADMSLENFHEMSADVADDTFLLRKAVEHRLANELPDAYRSRYSIVAYSHIPYRHAQQIGLIQQQMLDRLCAGIRSANEIDIAEARAMIERELDPYMANHGLALDYRY